MHLALPIPSLQHLAAVRVVTALWSQPAILTSIPRASSFDLYSKKDEWKKIEDTVTWNLYGLPLPLLLKDQLFRFINTIGLQINNWFLYHACLKNGINYFEDFISIPVRFCWTMHGTVDYRKTAELMLRNEGLVDFEGRYVIACINCLEDEARDSIQHLSQDRRRRLMNGFRASEDKIQTYLVVYFTCTLSANPKRLRIYVDRELRVRGEGIVAAIFQLAIARGCRATCEYFFEKLNLEKKAKVFSEKGFLIRTKDAKWTPPFQLLYYWSLLSEEQLESWFRKDAAFILELFMHWPLQPLFVEVVQWGWRLLDGSVTCAEVLISITKKITKRYTDYNYTRLFLECWRLTLDDAKQRFLGDEFKLEPLIKTKDREIIQLVLNEAPVRSKLNLLRRQKPMVQNVLVECIAIPDACLEECLVKAALESSKNEENEEKRLWSQDLSELVDYVLQGRLRLRRVRLKTSEIEIVCID